jgi:FixJ family two-component response regulator
MPNRVTEDFVAIIDDDEQVRRLLSRMLESLNIRVYAYASTAEYLDDQEGQERCACLILDVRLPGMSGMELQKRLLTQQRMPSIVFITGHADVPTAVEAMRSGAVDFLQKPFNEQQLLDSVQQGLRVERLARESRRRGEAIADRRARLTPRENDVLSGLLRGLRTREIAVELGIATRTAEEHRANVTNKMQATSIADLITMCGGTP